ncbi:hypothetical protein HI914_02315 [Erysiphe necator]|nr:hypothetical protein HI914_02315 [Erysiphe necator]
MSYNIRGTGHNELCRVIKEARKAVTKDFISHLYAPQEDRSKSMIDAREFTTKPLKSDFKSNTCVFVCADMTNLNNTEANLRSSNFQTQKIALVSCRSDHQFKKRYSEELDCPWSFDFFIPTSKIQLESGNDDKSM